MADCHDEDVPEEETPGYQKPAEKSVDEILNTDKDDEALEKYKKTLLGQAADGGKIIAKFPDNPAKVIVTMLSIIVDGRPDVELDLTRVTPGDKTKFPAIVIKEGATYKVKISFYVQREIVAGLRYVQQTYRKGIRVDSESHMVGSYGPKLDLQSFLTKPDEAPAGMIARGEYTIKSKFTDDDKNVYLAWDWTLKIKKDWKDSE